ncbi:MAG: N-acetylmuramoyl-L-alanine amidase, partial [Candidatus Limnocylindrales bacterium]
MRRLCRSIGPLIAALTLIALAPALPTQGRAPVGVVGHELSTSVDRSRDLELPFVATHVALHWTGAPDALISVAFSADGVVFSPAEGVQHDHAGGETPGHTFGSVTWTGGARFVRVTSDRPIARLAVVAIDSNNGSHESKVNGYVAAAAVEQATVVSRAGWGANESLRFDASGNEIWPPEFHPVQKLTVHHTAGKNNDPDPAATVRAIYHYNAVTNGWGDIGYNFLIDESGRIYEGRYSRAYADGETPTGENLAGNGVTGAHVGGYNAGTVGIALLGTLTNQDATPAARAALERLLAWKADRHAIDPLGSG